MNICNCLVYSFPHPIMTETLAARIGEIDRSIAYLHHYKASWEKTSIADRAGYLQKCLTDTLTVAEPWAISACHAKGIDPKSNLAGEEWIAGPISTVRNLRLLMTTLAADARLNPIHTKERENGQIVARVLPANLLDRVLWLGDRAEVWIEPGKALTQGRIYRESTPAKVALILGAGNLSGLVAMDILSKLFAENQVVILKLNPVNDYIGTYLAQAFNSLIQAGWLQIVYGGADVGEYLCQHPQIDLVHITGSHHTHDAIVWGATISEQEERKAANQPHLKKPITSELGNVSPILIVPGKWSKSDLIFQARQIASTVTNNASFNCAAGQVLVMASGWAQRAEFLAAVRQELAQIPPRQAYYPGAQARYQAFLDRYPQSERLGVRIDEILPWTIIPDVPTSKGEYALTEEAFCGILAEVSLDATSAPDFLTKAVDFANDRLWGTLSCTVIIDGHTQKKHVRELDTAIADLKYGAIGINMWGGMLFYLGSTTWGAYPGNAIADIGSGIGVVHNSYLFDYPQKSVAFAPFHIFPTPAWFATHKNLLALSRNLLKFEAYPTWKNLLPLIISALKG